MLKKLVNEIHGCTFFLSEEDNPHPLFEPISVHLWDLNGPILDRRLKLHGIHGFLLGDEGTLRLLKPAAAPLVREKRGQVWQSSVFRLLPLYTFQPPTHRADPSFIAPAR